jgi:hypothetical protein
VGHADGDRLCRAHHRRDEADVNVGDGPEDKGDDQLWRDRLQTSVEKFRADMVQMEKTSKLENRKFFWTAIGVVAGLMAASATLGGFVIGYFRPAPPPPINAPPPAAPGLKP